jgi:hypothetical protein
MLGKTLLVDYVNMDWCHLAWWLLRYAVKFSPHSEICAIFDLVGKKPGNNVVGSGGMPL